MLQDERDVENEGTDFRTKTCCLGRLFWATDKLQQIYKKNEPIKGNSFVEESVLFIFPCWTNENHATEPWTVGHVISERHWKSTFDLSEIVNNYGLKRGTAWQIPSFISQFSLKLYKQFWKYFHSLILGRLGRGYCKKNRVLEFLSKFLARLLQRF